MDHNMVLSYNYSNQNRQRRRTNATPLRAISMAMAVRLCNMERITQCSMTRASPEATGCRHRVTTCSVLPRRQPGRQSTKLQCRMYQLCWSFWWSSRCGSRILHPSPDGVGSWFSLKPLNATIGWVLAPILPNRTRQHRLFRTFHHEKGSSWHVGPQ